MGTHERDSRSLSHDIIDDESDTESKPNDAGSPDGLAGPSTTAPGKPGRKKNPNSQAARRDQNRIAQREFRLRKQQRIRDLEARVEILSGSKDETFSELRNIVKDLMAENHNLRSLIRSLGQYIGDGLGGVLPSLGFDRPSDFVDFINRAETDTAFEGFQRRKKATHSATSSPTINLNRKRTMDDDDDSSKSKKTKSTERDIPGKDRTDNERYSSLLSANSPTGGANYYSPSGRSNNEAGLFSELLQGQSTGSPMFMTGPTPSDSQNYYSTASTLTNPAPFAPIHHPPLNVAALTNSHTPPFTPAPNPVIATASLPGATTPTSLAPTTNGTDSDDVPSDPKLQEAMKLIHYHLDNYKRNNAYCLPQSLRPTLVQRTVPHESVIDGIPHPELRDRMILLRGRFDLVDCLHEYTRSLTLHSDDVLAHSNWEISEKWLRRFGYLVDQPILNICNRWRRERGDPELTLADLAPAPSETPSST